MVFNGILTKTKRHRVLRVYSLLGLVLVVCATTACKSVEEDIVIEATADEIWKVLIDAKGYPDWNNLIAPIEGSLQQGAYMTYRYTPPNDDPIDLRFKVETANRGIELRQTGGTWGLFTFDHQWILEAIPKGTRVKQREVFSGIMVLLWDSDWLPATYRAINVSLKEEVLRRTGLHNERQ